MGRKTPNIVLGTSLKKRDRLGFKEFVLKVNIDTFLYKFNPSDIEVVDGIFFILYLRNKKFMIDELQVDTIKDYIDIYLYGVKQSQNRYTIQVTENDIIIQFTEDITRLPNDVLSNDFVVKGKIAELE